MPTTTRTISQACPRQSEAARKIAGLRFVGRSLRHRGCCFLGTRAVPCRGTRVKHCFMNGHRYDYAITSMCRVLLVAQVGFYAWLHASVSDHAREDVWLLDLIRASYRASYGVDGARRIFGDLRKARSVASAGRQKVVAPINRRVGGSMARP